MKLRLILAASVACLCASLSIAATIKMKDGRTLVGEVKKLGNSYSILQADGTRSIVPAGEILSIDGKAPGAVESKPDAPAAATPSSANAGVAFKLAKSKADKADAPIVALVAAITGLL